ncbi:MAG TPA: Fic family protein [Acetobacteraceae bacterium]|jgi:Fic family protein|nr:Fic family protein [Acetobacteraceae bacterium]
MLKAAHLPYPSAGRAGNYRQLQLGYRAFIPAPLPPDPPVRIDGELQALLSRADLALGRLAGSIETLPNPDLFVLMYVRKEAVLSSQIEGTQSSLQDLLSAEAKVFNPEQPHDVAEVLNYVAAMNHGLVRLAALPVSVRLIREIHAKLLDGVRGSHLTPGELRTSQNWIGPAGCILNDAKFVRPPPAGVPDALGALERFLHTDDALPLLVKIGLAHAQFETIHPFLNGNGRVGRLLITFLLCENQVLSKPVLYLSHYFKRYRQSYYEHLQAVRDSGAFEAWLRFFLSGVIEVSLEASVTARRILVLREQHRELIADRLGRTAGNGHRTLEYLFAHPIVSVSEVRKLVGTSYPAANQLVERLAEIGILAEVTGHARNRRFRYDPYVRLFAET